MSRWLREIVLWTGAALGAVAVLVGIAVACFGYSFLIFRSGSMGPGIPTGSLALAKETPAADLGAGDVVSVMTVRGDRVTHRIVSVTLRGDEASLVLQGDANATPDDEVYVVTAAEREIASVPVLGYVVTVLLSPFGLAGAGCLAGMVLVVGFAGGPRDPDGPSSRPGPPRHRGDRVRAVAELGAVAALSTAVVVSGGAVQGTSAFFADVPKLTTATFGAATLSPATNVRCVDNGLADYVAWNAPVAAPAPTGFLLSYTGSTGSGSVSYGAGATQGRPPMPASLSTTYTVSITAVYHSWRSAVSTTSTAISGTVIGLIWSC